MSFFPERIKKVSFIIHQSDLERVIEKIHNEGIIQIVDIREEDPDMLKDVDVSESDSELPFLINYKNRLTRVISILRQYNRSNRGLRFLISPPKYEKIKVKKKDISTLYKENDEILQHMENVLQLDKKINEIEGRTGDINEELKNLSYIAEFDFDLSYVGESKYTIMKIGITKNIDSLKDELRDVNYIMRYKPIGKKKEKTWIIVLLTHISTKDRLEPVWQRYVNDLSLRSTSGKPIEVNKRLLEERDGLAKEKNKIKAEIEKIAISNLHELLAKREEVQIEIAKREIKDSFGRTERTYLIEGWVLEKDTSYLADLIKNSTGSRAIYRSKTPSPNPDNPPIYIKTSKWTEPFKPILELFGLPKYDEVNPLSFITFWFPLMFGFMLGDAGYGLTIFLLSLIGRLKWGKISPFIRSWSSIGIMFGIWSIVFGYISNGFFGDLLPRFLGVNLPSIRLGNISLPIDGLRNPIILLQLALIIGIIHINIGIVLAMIQNIKRKNIKEMVYGQISFIFLQIFGGALVGEYLLKIWSLSSSFEMISWVGVLVGTVLLTLKARGMSFFEIMGFVGDWLSYARLLALGLATAGMALAFNIVASLFGNMTNIVFAILVLIVAHPVTMALNSLGAAVHSLRLQYVEFFNRFYEGGGKKFKPFQIRRIYTEEI